MSRENCINPKIGSLLHAYELGILSEENVERFETHMLKCSHCFNEVKDFEPEAELLTSSDDVVDEISRGAEIDIQKSSRSSVLKRLWHYVWPKSPVIFRPAVAFILILLLIYPAYRGVMPGGEMKIKPVSSISLFPTRSTEPIHAEIKADRDIILSFVYQGAIPGEKYILELIDQEGKVVIRNDSFTDFDEFEVGQVFISRGCLDPGIYTLEISDPENPVSTGIQSYKFELIR